MLESDQSAHAAIAIAATFTADPLLPLLRFVLDQAGLALDGRLAPYNQLFQELLSPASLLATNGSGIDVVLVRVEDFVREVTNTAEAIAVIRRTVKELSDALLHHAQRAKVPTLLAVMPPSTGLTGVLAREIEAADAALVACTRSSSEITLISADDLDLVSGAERYDSVSDELAHLPFTEEHYASIALAIARKVHALRVPAHKVLVLDCDQTLWRGVVGEDGVDGLTIPPSLARLQEFAVKIQAQGALVCLVSKNAERDVLDVFARRADMILRPEHIVAHRINWDPKPSNVASLARALNLGLDSFVFVDDNPVECALMRAELPQVVTLQLPADDEIGSFLSHLWTFDKESVTEEDTRRTPMYRENARRYELEQSTTNIAEFIESLALVIDIAPPEENEWARIAQLTQRTNQFNLTTVRRSETEMPALPSDGFTVLRVKVSDRFGDYRLVGLIVASVATGSLAVDTFLLSCRVLGRGVEHAILRQLGELAKEQGSDQIDLEYVPTSKNEPARAFAESVVGKFRTEEHGRTIYRIPAESARAIIHRPGHDPAAVIEAHKSTENKEKTSDPQAATSSRSERYAKLAALVSGRDVQRAACPHTASSRAVGVRPAAPAAVSGSALAVLWEEVLGIDLVGADDDFFALGGTSLIAVRLIAAVSRRFGVKLPLSAIVEAPTFGAFSGHLGQQCNPSSGSLVELKRGGPRNLFIVHDGDGETLLYLNLARRMPDDLAVFGIEPCRLPGVPLAHTRIEDMAAFYLEKVRQRQPHGPYLFAGMCAGGVIAYEMGRQMSRSGEKLDLVALLDAARPKAQKKAWRVTEQRASRLKRALRDARNRKLPALKRARALGAALQKPLNALLWEFLHRGEQWSVRVRFRLLHRLLSRQRSWPSFVPGLTVRQIYDSAEACYVPKPLRIPSIVLVRGSQGEANDTPYKNIYADETFGWSTVAQALTVIDVAGGHSTMLQERFADSLAEALRPYVQPGEGSADSCVRRDLSMNGVCGAVADIHQEQVF